MTKPTEPTPAHLQDLPTFEVPAEDLAKLRSLVPVLETTPRAGRLLQREDPTTHEKTTVGYVLPTNSEHPGEPYVAVFTATGQTVVLWQTEIPKLQGDVELDKDLVHARDEAEARNSRFVGLVAPRTYASDALVVSAANNTSAEQGIIARLAENADGEDSISCYGRPYATNLGDDVRRNELNDVRAWTENAFTRLEATVTAHQVALAKAAETERIRQQQIQDRLDKERQAEINLREARTESVTQFASLADRVLAAAGVKAPDNTADQKAD